MAGAKNDLRNEQQREKREESREKREERGSRPRKTTTTRRREKREERREKSEERRERREETREKTEDRPQEAARGPQMRPPEGGQPFSMPCRPLVGPLAASVGDHLGTSPRLKNTQLMFPMFFLFFVGCGGGVSQG